MFKLKLLTCYLSAIIHDFEHRGVNNDFLIKTSDHLALLYNDSSPMENHHVASAFMIMKEDQYAFFPAHCKRVGVQSELEGVTSECCDVNHTYLRYDILVTLRSCLLGHAVARYPQEGCYRDGPCNRHETGA